MKVVYEISTEFEQTGILGLDKLVMNSLNSFLHTPTFLTKSQIKGSKIQIKESYTLF